MKLTAMCSQSTVEQHLTLFLNEMYLFFSRPLLKFSIFLSENYKTKEKTIYFTKHCILVQIHHYKIIYFENKAWCTENNKLNCFLSITIFLNTRNKFFLIEVGLRLQLKRKISANSVLFYKYVFDCSSKCSIMSV